MNKPYRVYRRHNGATMFRNNNDGTFTCTHGGWTGKHVAPASLDVGFKIIEYTDCEDLTEIEADKVYGGIEE